MPVVTSYCVGHISINHPKGPGFEHSFQYYTGSPAADLPLASKFHGQVTDYVASLLADGFYVAKCVVTTVGDPSQKRKRRYPVLRRTKGLLLAAETNFDCNNASVGPCYQFNTGTGKKRQVLFRGFRDASIQNMELVAGPSVVDPIPAANPAPGTGNVVAPALPAFGTSVANCIKAMLDVIGQYTVFMDPHGLPSGQWEARPFVSYEYVDVREKDCGPGYSTVGRRRKRKV